MSQNKEWSLDKVSVVLDSEGIFNTTFNGGTLYRERERKGIEK